MTFLCSTFFFQFLTTEHALGYCLYVFFTVPFGPVGDVFSGFRNCIIRWKKHHFYAFNSKNVYMENYVKHERKHCSRKRGSFTFCLSSENVPSVHSKAELLSGKVIYSVAPAMGHNKVWISATSDFL